MAYQTPSFELSPSTRARIDTPRRRPKRPSAADTPLQIADAQAKRSKLEALPSVECIMYATCIGASWTLTDEAGAVVQTGSAGQDHGVHRTLSIAIGKAVALAALSATDSSACHLTVRVSDTGFRYVNRVGTPADDGKGGKVRGLALRAFKARVLLTVKCVRGIPAEPRTEPRTQAPAVPIHVPVHVPAGAGAVRLAFSPEHYVDELVQALRVCTARMSIDEISKYQITRWVSDGDRQFIRSLALEPAMADVRAAEDARYDAMAESHGFGGGELPF